MLWLMCCEGAAPAAAVEWNRINQGEVLDCDAPTTFGDGVGSSDVVQGALANAWFVGALSSKFGQIIHSY